MNECFMYVIHEPWYTTVLTAALVLVKSVILEAL